MLLEAGVDASFWMEPQFYVPDPPTESSLSVSSPLHAAIESDQTLRVCHLLSLGFDVNAMPLSTPTRCLTPLMPTIAHHWVFKKGMFNILASQPNINFELWTPVYGVHIIHFAVARLDLGMPKYVVSETPLRNARVMPLGHTLLHVACMPADSLEVMRHSKEIYRSIHETRHLHPTNDPNIIGGGFDKVYDVKDHSRQTAVVKYVWDNGTQDLEKTDTHGNTALHYLAGYRNVNWDLIIWWQYQQGVEGIWTERNNKYGFTRKSC
jgi:hypothetical protein